MKPMIKLLFLSIICVPGVFIQTTHAQDSRFDYNYDSLADAFTKAETDADKVKLLTLLVDFAPESGQSVATDKVMYYLIQLLEYNKRSQVIDSSPYEVLLKGYSAWRKGNFQEALAHLREAVELFDRQKKVIIKVLGSIRILFTHLNQQEERYKFYKEKLDHYLINGPLENTAACYHGIAGYYTHVGDYNLAISNYLKAASVLKQFNTLFYKTFYYNEIANVGRFYSTWGNDQKARQYLEMAMQNIMAINVVQRTSIDSAIHAICLIGLSNIAVREQKYDEALQYTNESIKNCYAIADLYAIAVLQKGFIYLEKKQPVSAYPYLAEVKGSRDSLNSEITSTAGLLELDFAFYQYNDLLNNYPVAVRYLSTAYTKAVQEKSHQLQLKYLKEFSAFYKRQQRPALALQYLTEYIELKEQKEQEQGAFKVAQYENESKELEQNNKIYALRRERELQEATISKRNTVLVISLAAMLLIGISMAFLYRQFNINKNTLLSLRRTQRQLVLSEKMASLGEVTAGIAHEIQNPLNFVNNFSEVNAELIVEMKAEIDKGNIVEATTIADEVLENEQKINHHGKRADAIVKGMLQHSRTSNEQKQLTKINALADEYLRLAFHGWRAKDKSFNATMKSDYDDSIEKINVIPQEIGRVILNLATNAFYAVNEKKKQLGNGYEPTVTLITRKQNDRIEIRVRDNGNGIPEKVMDKIFQPFFTTKPTGQGTGLGLSLSYDVIKAHGGEIKVESKEGEYSEFVIILPV